MAIDPALAFQLGLRRHAESLRGHELAGGTTVVADEKRTGSGFAAVYPIADHTIVFVDPSLSDRLGHLESEIARPGSDVVDALVEQGGEFVGTGNIRVLADDADPDPGPSPAGERFRLLDATDPGDLDLLAAFVDACDPDDLDEAELELDDLDPHIGVLVVADPDGSVRDEIVAYASSHQWDLHRPAEDEALGPVVFDDIGVIVHPGYRRQGAGRRVVARFVEQRRASGVGFLYRNDVRNIGSDRLAISLGFSHVTANSGVRFESIA